MSAIIVPLGVRIHTVHVRVKPARLWQEAVNAACPDTFPNKILRDVGSCYPPTDTDEVEEDLVLLNYPEGNGSWEKALAWSSEKGLKNTAPREVFAVGEQHPNLNRILAINPMYVVSTAECVIGDGRRACCVWWYASDRQAGFELLNYFGRSVGWFAFRKPVKP